VNFQISYAPSHNTLTSQLEKIPSQHREEARKMAQELGLIRYSEKTQSYYDFYRERVVFPIHDHSGQVRGFQCRKVLDEQQPKFLNSSDSFVFHKANILYGYFLAKNAIRQHDQVFIVEGNMDVVMMHQYGFPQTVGTQGTAFSESSLRLLSNMTKNIFLAMDSDASGLKAMQEINAKFMQQNLLPRFLSFAPAKDPDEFLREQGRLALLERIEAAPRFVDWMIEKIIPSPIPELTDKKLQVLREIFQLLAPLRESLEATERVIYAAKLLRLRSDETSLTEQYKSYLSSQDKAQPAAPLTAQTVENKEFEAQEETISLESAQEGPIALIDIGPLLPIEKIALKTFLTHPEVLTQPQLHEILAFIRHPEVKEFLTWLVKIYLEMDDQEYVPIISREIFSERYGRELQNLVAEALDEYKPEPLNEKVIHRMLQDLKLRLQVEQKRQLRKELTQKQLQSETQEEVIFYMQEITKIDRELQELKKNPL
jgi:DNA primase